MKHKYSLPMDKLCGSKLVTVMPRMLSLFSACRNGGVLVIELSVNLCLPCSLRKECALFKHLNPEASSANKIRTSGSV